MSRKVYLGRAPGDLPEIPNKGKETWLEEPILIFIFMDVIPWIAAVIICFLALTVIGIGFSLLCKYICLLYGKKVKYKRLKKRRKKVAPMEKDETSESEGPSRRVSSTKTDRILKKQSGKAERETMSSEKESEEDAEYGILTGTKRKKKDTLHHHHRHHHHKEEEKHQARHAVAKIMKRVRDGVLGKKNKTKPETSSNSKGPPSAATGGSQHQRNTNRHRNDHDHRSGGTQSNHKTS